MFDRYKVSICIIMIVSSVHMVRTENWIDIHNNTDGNISVVLTFQPPLETPWNETAEDPDVWWPQKMILEPGAQHKFGARNRTLLGKPCINEVEIKKITGKYTGSSTQYKPIDDVVCLGTSIIHVEDDDKVGGIIINLRSQHKSFGLKVNKNRCNACSIR